MLNRTFEELFAELETVIESDALPTEEQMRELFAHADKEVNSFLPGVIEDTAHHIGHGDERRDLVNSLAMRLEMHGPAPAVVAAILIYHLAQLRISGVDVGYPPDHGTFVVDL